MTCTSSSGVSAERINPLLTFDMATCTYPACTVPIPTCVAKGRHAKIRPRRPRRATGNNSLYQQSKLYIYIHCHDVQQPDWQGRHIRPKAALARAWNSLAYLAVCLSSVLGHTMRQDGSHGTTSLLICFEYTLRPHCLHLFPK